MIFSVPHCPQCGQPATATLETVQGLALLQGPDAQGHFEYEGETKIDWDSQTTCLDRNGLVTLSCDQRHEWQALRGELAESDR